MLRTVIATNTIVFPPSGLIVFTQSLRNDLPTILSESILPRRCRWPNFLGTINALAVVHGRPRNERHGGEGSALTPHSHIIWRLLPAILGVAAVMPTRAFAQQRLEEFLAGARKTNSDLQVAAATIEQQEGEVACGARARAAVLDRPNTRATRWDSISMTWPCFRLPARSTSLLSTVTAPSCCVPETRRTLRRLSPM